MLMTHRWLLAVALCFAVASAWSKEVSDPEVRRFIASMSVEHGFAEEELTSLFTTVTKKQSILDAISRPAERVVPWFEYRDRFLTDTRIAQGATFWNEQQQALDRAEQSGVDAKVIVGILGVETIYGRNTGKFRVIDALSTLAFHYPPRADFFRKELAQFLLLTRDEQVDPAAALGSYAGAMGAPQFIASSYRNFAVDGDGDGHRNLWQSWPDVIASVANYLAAHGWKRGEPISTVADVSAAKLDQVDSRTLALNETVGSLRAKGVKFETSLADDAPAMLVQVQGRSGPEFRVGFTNFYAITRYNRSSMYALAVQELGIAIATSTSLAKS